MAKKVKAEEQEIIQQELELDMAEESELRREEAVVEAVLFTMGKSVEVRQLAAALETDEKRAKKAALRLMERYQNENRGMQVIELEDSFQMCTKAEFYESLIRVASTPKKQVLTDVVLETLSIIAYKQPVTKMEIEKIRGVKSDHAVNRLVEYNLVYEVGRLDAPGRPALFATTEEFLRRFGVGSTQDLPTMNPERMEEIKAEVEEELQFKLEELEEGGENAADGENPAGEAAAAREGDGTDEADEAGETGTDEADETGADEGRAAGADEPSGDTDPSAPTREAAASAEPDME